MNARSDPWGPGGALRQAVGAALERHFGTRTWIVALEHQPAVYRSSYPIEELELELAEGTRLSLLFKDLSTPPESKPRSIHDPQREIRVYQRLLADADLGTAVCYGSLDEPRAGLLLENVAGIQLFQLGEAATWRRAAAWLARLHERFSVEADGLHDPVPLPRWDSDYCGRWPTRALALFAGGEADRRALVRIVRRYEPVVTRLCELPVSLIHGEFYPANVLVREPVESGLICPVDWEMAAIGPALIDVAALVAGRWSEVERTALALAYREAAPAKLRLGGQDEFLKALDCCRLHLALQWLGWSANFSPPPEQRHDWLDEALSMARRLGL